MNYVSHCILFFVFLPNCPLWPICERTTRRATRAETCARSWCILCYQVVSWVNCRRRRQDCNLGEQTTANPGRKQMPLAGDRKGRGTWNVTGTVVVPKAFALRLREHYSSESLVSWCGAFRVFADSESQTVKTIHPYTQKLPQESPRCRGRGIWSGRRQREETHWLTRASTIIHILERSTCGVCASNIIPLYPVFIWSTFLGWRMLNENH